MPSWCFRLLTWWHSLILACQRGLLTLLVLPIKPAVLELVDQRVRLVVQALHEEEEQLNGPARRAAQAELADRVRLARQGRLGSSV